MPRDPLDDPDLHVTAHILDIRDDTYHIIGTKQAAWSEKGLRGSYSIIPIYRSNWWELEKGKSKHKASYKWLPKKNSPRNWFPKPDPQDEAVLYIDINLTYYCSKYNIAYLDRIGTIGRIESLPLWNQGYYDWHVLLMVEQTSVGDVHCERRRYSNGFKSATTANL